MSLFELSRDFDRLLSSENDESDDDFFEALSMAEAAFKDKVIDCVKYVKNLEMQSDTIKQAMDAMQKRKQAMDKRVDGIKEYVLQNMELTALKTVECEYFKVSVKKNPPSVFIFDESQIPAHFISTKQVVSIDKTAIKQAGGCDGVSIIQKQSLSIR